MDTKINLDRDRAIKFVVRRAFRFGEVRRVDVQNAFGVSQATSANIISEAIRLHQDVLDVQFPNVQMSAAAKRKNIIYPRAGVKAPFFASEECLLQQLTSMDNSYAELGLSPEELGVNYVNTSIRKLASPGILSLLVKAISHKKLIDMTYIGMKALDQPKLRTISPIGLENMHGQWRLLAVDFPQTPDSIVKTFVLSRIIDVNISLKKGRYSNLGLRGAEVKIPITLNPILNKFQQEAVRVELNIHEDNYIQIPERGKFEYLQIIADLKKNESAIWPPILLR